MMTFGRQIYASVAQALYALSQDAAGTLLFKHLGTSSGYFQQSVLLDIVRSSPDDGMRSLICELISQGTSLRHSAPTRHVFDSRLEDLTHWLTHDGWKVQGGTLLRIAPAVDEITGIRDRLLDELAEGGLDADGTVRKAIADAATAFNSSPPDFNDSVVKVRMALETIGRRAAVDIASRRQTPYEQDS